jgi:beta-phosphoglucomutase-like phosphatase (HAD superfamily)
MNRESETEPSPGPITLAEAVRACQQVIACLRDVHPGPITLAEAVQAVCSDSTEDRAAFLDRVRASTRHPEQVVDLKEVRRGRARAEMFIQALEAINQRDKK